jgi:hypothetical protein
MEDNLARKIEEPRDKGVDGAGRTFRERIEVTLEDDGPEWDEKEGEREFWRARGKVRAVDIEVDDPTGEGEGTGWLEE